MLRGQAFDTPRGKRARAAASPAQESGEEGGGDGADEPSQPLLRKISQMARWVVGMS